MPTPVTELRIDDRSKWGQRDRDIFFQNADQRTHELYALRATPSVETILVILANPLTPPPSTIDVDARELASGATTTFIARSTESDEYTHGTGWIGNFEFPRSGCWQLVVVVPQNKGLIVVEVE
jgi:hypothetical protein